MALTIIARKHSHCISDRSLTGSALVVAIGLVLALGFLVTPYAAAQNVNDLLRLIAPPPPAPPPPVYYPRDYYPREYYPRGYYPPERDYYPPPRPAPRYYAPRSTGSEVSRSQVWQVQQMLNDLGYDAGVVDGVAGRKTIDALNAFRYDNGLTISSTVDRQSVITLSAVHRSKTSHSPATTTDRIHRETPLPATEVPGSPGQAVLPVTHDEVKSDTSQYTGITTKPDLDVIGIRLGMSMEDAEKLIRQHMSVGRVLEGRRLYDNLEKLGNITPATSGKLFISEDEHELIAIIDEPPAVAGTVLATWRRIYMPPGSLQETDAIRALQEKYGEQGHDLLTTGGGLVWRNGPDDDNCRLPYGVVQQPTLSAIWTENGEPAQLRLSEDEHQALDAMLPDQYRNPLDKRYEKTAGCGTYIAAQLDFEASRNANSGLPVKGMDWIEQSLTEPGRYMQAYKQSRKAVQTVTRDDGHTSKTKQRPTVLKF